MSVNIDNVMKYSKLDANKTKLPKKKKQTPVDTVMNTFGLNRTTGQTKPTLQPYVSFDVSTTPQTTTNQTLLPKSNNPILNNNTVIDFSSQKKALPVMDSKAQYEAKHNITSIRDSVPKAVEENSVEFAKNILQKPEEDNVAKVILGTTGDIGLNIAKGVTQVGEGIVNLGKAGLAEIADIFQGYEFADKLRQEIKNNPNPASDKLSELQKRLEPASVLGSSGDQIVQGIGYTATLGGGQMLGGASLMNLLTFASATGSGYSEAMQKEGATDEQIWVKAITSGSVETLTENLFGLFGKTGLDDAVANNLSQKASSAIGKALTRNGVMMGSEASEEIISAVLNHAMDKMLVDVIDGGNGAKFAEKLDWGQITQEALSAGLSAGLTGAGGNIRAVSQIARDNNVSMSEALNQYENELDEKGYQDKLLGQYEKALNKELKNNKKLLKSTEDMSSRQKIQDDINVLQNELNRLEQEENEASELPRKGFTNQAQQTTQEGTRTAENVTSELTREIGQNLLKSIEDYNNSRSEGQEIFDLNNEETKKEIEAIQKIADDRGIEITFDANEFDDNITNAFYDYDDNGKLARIVLNPNTSTRKYVQNLTIHELLHSFSGNKKENLMKEVLNYTKTLDGYNEAYADLRKAYEKKYGKNVSEDVINEEAVANILGERLGSKEFVEDLINGKYATQNRKWTTRLYEFVKNQINRFRGYKDQVQYWKHVKELFDDAYRKSEINKGQAYSADAIKMTTTRDSEGNHLSKGQVEYFRDSKVRDENGNLKVMYHGTNADFNEFDTNKIDIANLGKGFYFTDIKEIANSYAERRTQERGGKERTVEAYINSVKPFDMGNVTREQVVEYLNYDFYDPDNTIMQIIRTGEQAKTEAENFVKEFEEEQNMGEKRVSRAEQRGFIKTNNKYDYSMMIDTSSPTFQKWLRKEGYDALIVPGQDKKTGIKGNAVVVFNSNQIKNTDNLNPTSNPDIRYSIGGEKGYNTSDSLPTKEELVNNIYKNVENRTSKENQKNNARIENYLKEAYPNLNIEFTNYKNTGEVVINSIQTNEEYEKQKIQNKKNYIKQEKEQKLNAPKLPVSKNDEYHLNRGERPSTKKALNDLEDIQNRITRLAKKMTNDNYDVFVDKSKASPDATYLTIINSNGDELGTIRIGNHFKLGTSGNADIHIDLSKYISKKAVVDEVEKAINSIINKNTDSEVESRFRRMLEENRQKAKNFDATDNKNHTSDVFYDYKLHDTEKEVGLKRFSEFASEHNSDFDDINNSFVQNQIREGIISTGIYNIDGNLVKLTTTREGNKLFIDELYVEKQRQGTGTKVINLLKDYAEKAGLTLDASDELTKAKGFWDKVLNRNTNANNKQYSVDTRNDGTLLAIHNLTADKLQGVLELDGFPVPSIAITNQPHTQFGDISVIFDKNTIDPANIENEVYDRDVWSPTFPRVDYDISNSDIKKYVSKDLDLYSKDDIINSAVTNYFYDTNLLDKIDSRGIDGTLEAIKNSKEMKYLYLNKIAKEEFKPIMKQAEFSNSSDYGNEQLQEFLDWYKGTPLNELSFDEKMALGEKISELVRKRTEADLEKSFKDSDLSNGIKESIKKFSLEIAENYKENFGKIDNFIYSAMSMQRNGSDYQVIDQQKTLDNVDNVINQKEYEEWVDSTFGELFKNTRKGIRNKKDAFTSSGNRRSFNQLHDEYSLSNLVKAMVAERTTGVDNFSVSGFGAIQAKRAKQFKSIQDIKNNEDLLTSSELTPEILEPLKDSIVDDIDILAKYYKSSSTFDTGFDNSANAISEFAEKKNLTPDAFKKVLKSYYNFDVDNIPSDFIQEVINDLHSLENIQTDYFEAKPQRAVGLDEVKAMVIPNNLDANLKQQLQDRGIKLVEYDPNVEGDREAKLKSAELQNLRFSKDTSGAWDDFVQKYFKTEGTGTAIRDMKKLPTKSVTIQDFEDVIEQYNLPTADKNNLKNDLQFVEMNKKSLDEFKEFVKTYNEAYQETLKDNSEDILDTTKTYSNGRKQTYVKYLRDSSKYDRSALDRAMSAIPGKQGRRTKDQWLLIARQMGTEIANKSDAEIEKIAYRTWLDEAPNQKSQLNRQGEKFVKFNSDDWINAVYNQVKDVRQKYSVETEQPAEQPELPKETKIEEEEIKLPTVTEEDSKSRKHYRTYYNSENLSKQDRETAKELFRKEKYIPIGNVESLTKANSRIERNGLDSVFTELNNNFNDSKKMTLDDIVTMERMIQMYSARGDSAKVNQLMQQVAIIGTELGQRVQALSIIRKMSPEGQLQMLQRLVDRTNQKENSDLKITDEQADRILRSNGEKELNDNVTKVVEEIAQELNVKFGDEVRAWRYLSMLGNPRTHVRNLLGNVAMNVLQNAKNKVAGAGEDLASLINPNLERTKTLRRANKDQREFAKNDAKYMEDMIDGGGKYDMKNIMQSAKRTSNLKVLNAIEKFNSNLLDLEDKLFLRKAYAQAMRDYMSANKLSSKDMEDTATLEKARQYATLQAQEATFHQYSALASQISQIESRGGVTGFLTSAILPFKKTPINIAKTGIEYSPIGIVSSVGNMVKNVAKDTKNLKTQLQDGKITKEQYNSEIANMVNKRIDQMAKGLTGTSLALLGYALAKQGILKAGNGDDEDEFEEKLGKQTYSITIGDNNFSLDWLAPSAVPLFVGANFSYLANGDENSPAGETAYDRLGNTLNTSVTSLTQALEPMTEMSMLQGLASSLSSYEQDSSTKLFDIGASAVQSYAGQFVPTALGQVAKTIDPVVRDTTSTKKGLAKKLDQFKNQTMSKIPGVSMLLPAKTNVWGEEKRRPENAILRLLENAVLPYNREKIISDTTSEKLKEVYEETGEKGALPGTVQKYITMNKQKYNLNNTEFNSAKKVYGQTSKKMLDKVIDDTRFKDLDSETQVKMIQDIYLYAKEEFKLKYADDNNIDYEAKVRNSAKKYNMFKEYENDETSLKELINQYYGD